MSDTTFSDADAISAALKQDWELAIEINLALLKTDKNNISLLNRLGYAYMQNGKMTLAKQTFQKVIKLDEYNQIAQKNLTKLNNVRQKDVLKAPKHGVEPMFFLEEPGKTKIIECVNAAPMKVLSVIFPGEEVELKARNHTVEVRSADNTYLAALPDDLSFRLIKFLAVGNTYQALVKGITKNSLILFIRELSRGKRFANQPSFATSALYVPFAHTDRPDDGTAEPDAEKEPESEE